MSNKAKEIIKTKILEIREKLGYTQKQFGEILEVSERMVCNYETGESNLPPDKAVLLSQKYNYSLDWIYCNTEKSNNIIYKNYTEEENLKFLVDIRDFITCLNDKIIFSVNNNYWDYIKSVNIIKNSYKTTIEKERDIKELNGKYKKEKDNDVVWEFSIDIQDFLSKMRFNEKSIPYAFSTMENLQRPTEEQKKEAIDFLNLLVNEDEE